MPLSGSKNILFGKMTFGTTSKPMKNSIDLLIDTGSSWTWVYSCDKEKNPYWQDHYCPYFKQWESSTLTPVEDDPDKEARFGKYGITNLGKKGIATKSIIYGDG